MFTNDHVAVCVTDLERSRAFYTAYFGAKVLSQPSSDFLELGVGDLRLHLIKTAPPTRAPEETGISHFCLKVPTRSDLEAFAQKLRGSDLAAAPSIQVHAAEPTNGYHLEERPPSHVIYFKDPDGVMIEVRTYRD